ncbi:MAG TPA: NADH-quinone oxidoreductase subunit NuoG [Thermomicrobiales bacterium]|nr:NADH-quinone oxidoreductase subunit NuoG [Thermomicrobiales bacterium]
MVDATKPAAPPDTVTLTINGQQVTVPKGTLLVEAAKAAGIDIPVFCYEPRMAPVGACRMCLVQIERMPKLQTACTTPVADGMVVNTVSEQARDAQRDVLAFLLSNHPLDCPVCDKGGECPLQDTTFNFGPGVSNFYEPKRQFVKPIPLSPLIALDRERCIMCYRCVRFQREIACDEALTVIDRGSYSEIAVSEGRTFDSPFSGNTIELCPVGALTSIPFRFRARPWDLTKVPSVCNECAVGCNINVEYRNNQVLRLTARANPPVDDGWLCDYGRFTYDYVNSTERLRQPLIRRGTQLVPATWDEALDAVAAGFRRIRDEAGADALAGVISPRATNEELYLFGKLFRGALGTNNVDHWPRIPALDGPFGVDALHGSIEALERARTILLVGVNPIAEQPVLDLRLKKAANRGARLIVVGPEETDLDIHAAHALRVAPAALPDLLAAWTGLLASEGGYDQVFVAHRTTGFEAARAALAGNTPVQAAAATGLAEGVIAAAGRALAGDGPVAILYRRDYATGRPDDPYLAALTDLALLTGALDEDGVFGGLVHESNAQGALDLGILPDRLPGHRFVGTPNGLGETWHTALPARPGRGWREIAGGRSGVRALYVAGIDPLAPPAGEAPARPEGVDFLVVQDLFLTATARAADVVLPAVSWAEKDGTLTNLERRVQRIRPAVRPPGEARPDWRVYRDLGRRLAESGFGFSSPLAVWQELAAAVPAYGALAYGALARGGRQWPLPEHAGPFAFAAGRGGGAA